VSLSRHAAVVVILAFVGIAVSSGLRQSVAVLFPAILDDFGWSRTALSVAPALAGGLGAFSGLAIGALSDRFDIRVVMATGAAIGAAGFFLTHYAGTLWQFYVFYGVLGALGGSALSQVPQTIVIAGWFGQRRGTAIGIASAGSGAGTLVIIPALQSVILRYGWRAGYLMLSVILALMVPVILLFQRSAPTSHITPAAESPGPTTPRAPGTEAGPHPGTAVRFLQKMAREPRYWLTYAQMMLGPLSINAVSVHQGALLLDRGVEPMRVAWIVSLYGLSTLLGMLASGLLSDRVGREKAYSLGTLSLLVGLAFLYFMRPGSTIYPVFYAIAFGFGFGTRPSMDAATAADIFGRKRFGLVLGTLSTALGIGSLTGPLVGGFIHDATASYQGALLFSAVCVSAATVFIWLAAPRHGPADL
jgi:MFS family permease